MSRLSDFNSPEKSPLAAIKMPAEGVFSLADPREGRWKRWASG